MLQLEYIIKKNAERNKLSLSKVEALAGISKNYIHVIFKKNDCQVSTLKSIAKVLKMELWQFFYEENPVKQSECEKELLKAYKELNEIRKEHDVYKTIILNEPKTKYKIKSHD